MAAAMRTRASKTAPASYYWVTTGPSERAERLKCIARAPVGAAPESAMPLVHDEYRDDRVVV
jgi:hypothetical protein